MGSKHVAVITEAIARHFWPGQSASGKRFHYAIDNHYREVVGACANSVTFQIGEQPQPVLTCRWNHYYSSAVVMHVANRLQ